jgi:hypothetical protein
LLFNNGMAAPTQIACDSACFAANTDFAPGATLNVRDVVARTDNGTALVADGVSALVPPNGTALLRLSVHA